MMKLDNVIFNMHVRKHVITTTTTTNIALAGQWTAPSVAPLAPPSDDDDADSGGDTAAAVAARSDIAASRHDPLLALSPLGTLRYCLSIGR
jgi:hypothetical protein